MVEQKLFTMVGLLRMTEGGKSRLLRISKGESPDTFDASELPFLSGPQDVLDVYPEANLIVTQDKLMTIDGRIIFEHDKAHITVELVSDKWMIIEDMLVDSDSRYRITLWDGARECCCFFGRYILRSEKYLAVYTVHDCLWRVYLYDGRQVLEIHNPEKDMVISGDFLLLEGLGSHAAYALAEIGETSSDDKCIFSNQQLILCSSYENFALCCDLQGVVRTYFRGQYHDFGRVESVDFYDHAGVFSIQRNGRYFLYRLSGTPFAENICPYGANAIAYDRDENTLLIDTNSVFHLVRL